MTKKRRRSAAYVLPLPGGTRPQAAQSETSSAAKSSRRAIRFSNFVNVELSGDHRKNLSTAGWSWGMTTATDAQTRILFVVDAHRDDGSRFAVRSDEPLTAFLELERRTLPT